MYMYMLDVYIREYVHVPSLLLKVLSCAAMMSENSAAALPAQTSHCDIVCSRCSRAETDFMERGTVQVVRAQH